MLHMYVCTYGVHSRTSLKYEHQKCVSKPCIPPPTFDISVDNSPAVNVYQPLECLIGIVSDHILIQTLFGQRPDVSL